MPAESGFGAESAQVRSLLVVLSDDSPGNAVGVNRAVEKVWRLVDVVFGDCGQQASVIISTLLGLEYALGVFGKLVAKTKFDRF